MCCRYYMEMSPELRPIVEAAQRSKLYRNNIQKLPKPLTTEGEVFPDAHLPSIAMITRSFFDASAAIRSVRALKPSVCSGIFFFDSEGHQFRRVEGEHDGGDEDQLNNDTRECVGERSGEESGEGEAFPVDTEKQKLRETPNGASDYHA